MKKLNNFFDYLLFFPSITFSVLNSEIFPWAYIRSKTEGFKLYKNLYNLYILFIFSITYTLIYTNFQASPIEIIRSLIAYLNPILIFFFIINSKKINTYNYINIIKNIFCATVIFGLIQYSGILLSLEKYFRFFIPRLYMQQIGGGRGVSLFSSEPSRASYEFLFLYIFIRTFLIKKWVFFFDLLFFSYSFLIIKSTTGILLSFIYFLPTYRKQLPALILIFLTSIIIFIDLFPENRAVFLFSTLASNITSLSIKNVFLLLLNESGYRLISLIAAYTYGCYTIIGTGVGNWEFGISTALKFLNIDPANIAIYNQLDGVDFVSTRPTSFISSYFLDFGIFGFLVLLKSIWGVFKNIYNSISKKLFYTFLVYIFFVGDIGNPIPWIIIALSYKITLQRNLSINFNK
jgi:hypothetical protein